MIKNNYTSLKLSKKLAEYMDLSSSLPEYVWAKNALGTYEIRYNNFISTDIKYPAYDILNGICVKRVVEFFGEEYYKPDYSGLDFTEMILGYLQSGEKEEAEKFIWEHCKFNPKNQND